MIRSFADGDLEILVRDGPGRRTRRIPVDLYRVIIRKIAYMNQAVSLSDLRMPPANRLEQLKGDLSGHYSIRINDQYRLVFRWDDGDALDVRFMDYH